AGNSGSNNDSTPQYPANYNSPGVISVASSTADEVRSGFSSFGATTVDLAAPGSDIASATVGNNYAYFSGTSMAAPHVAGVVALLRDAAPDSTIEEVKDELYADVDQVSSYTGLVASGGRLNAAGALAALVQTPAVPTSLSLDAASDSGISDSDGNTNVLRPTINGTAEAGATVRLFADGTEVGSTVAGNDGAFALTATQDIATPGTDVVVNLTAVAENSAGTSDASAPLSLIVDTLAPTFLPGDFLFDALPNRLTFDVNEAVYAGDGGISTQNLTTGADAGPFSNSPIGVSTIELDYDGTIDLGGQSVLADGNYLATLAAGAYTDEAGNASPLTTAEFFVLSGDANRDRTVNLADFLVLRQNFGSGSLFSEGDFNYDGAVDLQDFLLLRGNFGTTLTPNGSLFGDDE
ncbi:MAG: S8 family serine peptidase, partial [Planctomycetota bacterium]